MPDEEDPKDGRQEDADDTDGPLFSLFGLASAVLGVVCVAAVVLGAVVYSAHRDENDERDYRGRVLWTAVEWTSVLINMNSENVTESMQRLREGTVGDLNANFNGSLQPFTKVVQQLKAHSTGRIEAVAIESVRATPRPGSDAARDEVLSGLATRTDTVVVVATSKAENIGGEPKTVPWNLRLDVSDVDGTLLVSRLGLIK